MIQPEFDIGDQVFIAEANLEKVPTRCPDCLGNKKWTVNTPAGEEFTIDCTTCWRGYEGSDGQVYPYERHPSTREMTVGSVRIDTHDDDPVSYMMLETGVGSGVIHYSANVFASRDEAIIKAKKICDACCAEDVQNDERRRENLKKSARRRYLNIDAENLRKACVKHGGDEIWSDVTGFKRLRAKAVETSL